MEDSFNTTEAHPAVSAVSMLGRLDLNVLGPRLNHTKEEKTSVIHGQDHRLNMVVVPAMPLLEVCTMNQNQLSSWSVWPINQCFSHCLKYFLKEIAMFLSSLFCPLPLPLPL